MSSSDQRNSAEDIKAIVSYLKQPPFSRNDSLVSFSRLSPLELLQLVNDIFASLDSKQQRDLRDEPSDVTTHRMIDFLITTLKYLPSSIVSSSDDASSSASYTSEQLADFGSSFISAAPATIYPVMLYLLSHYESLKKRAYLATYLTAPALPADMMGDPTLLSLLHSIQQQQAAFTQLHKETDAIRASALHATALRREVDQLEAEREQLKTKMKRLATRVESEEANSSSASAQSGGFTAMLKYTNMLRVEQEEESKIVQQREEQKQRVDELRSQLKQRTKQYDDMCRYHGVSKDRSTTAPVNPLNLFQRLKSELAEEEEQVNHTLQVELADKQKTISHLTKTTGHNGSDYNNTNTNSGGGRMEEFSIDEVDDIETAYNDTTKKLKQLEAQKEDMIGGNESQLGFLYDRLSAIQKKREKLSSKLKEMESEVDEVRMERDKIQSEMDKLSNTRDQNELNGIPRNSKELKKYMENLTVKTAEYKKIKFQLDSLYAEQNVLTHTFHTLQTRCSNQTELNSNLEKLKGIDGFTENESLITNLAIKGQALDEAKSENLEEISALVEKIEAEIKAKKNVLAPSIKELRSVRNNYESMENEYNNLKSSHEKIGLRYSSERLKLEGEVREKQNEKLLEERSKYQAEIDEKLLTIRENVLKSQNGRMLVEYESNIDKEMKSLEKKERSLQREKRSMLDNGNRFVNQRNLFKNMEFLLIAREKALVKESGGGGSGEKDRLVF